MALTLLDHGDALSAINADQDAAVARDVSGALGGYVQRPDLAHTAHVLLPQIIDLHAHNAGLITAHWYDGLAPSSKFRAKPFADVPREQVDKVIDWALHAPGDEPPLDRLIGSSQRLVRGASRQTVTRNAAKEGVRWARYAKPTACSFCRALSIRGTGREDHKYLYDSDKSAEFRESDGEKYHTHCACEPIAIREGTVWTPPEYAADWANQYNEAAKSTTGGAKYFQRVVAQMRANEPRPEPKPEPKAAAGDANVVELAPPDPERIAARQALDAAVSFKDVQTAAAKALPNTRVRISNEPLFFSDDAGSPNLWERKQPTVIENVKAMVRAADDMVTKYPELDLESLQDASEHDFGDRATYAHTRHTPGRVDGHQVQFNRSWLANPANMDTSWQTGIETGFHYEGSDNPVYDVMIHEMGHIMQRTAEDHGVYIEDRDIVRALSEAYLTTDAAQQTAPSYRGYQEWLADNLSGYSMHTAASGGTVGAVNGREALAEAFADVEINGDDAHETSVVLHGLLVDAYTESLTRPVEGGSSGVAAAV